MPHNHHSTYSEVKRQLGPLVFNLGEITRFLVCFEAVCEGGGVCGRDEAGQKTGQCKYGPHCGGCVLLTLDV
jgi:hypothetical protein